MPDAFSYFSVHDPNEIYEVYPQKLLQETWNILQQAGLAGARLANADYPTAGPTGLSLMSLLADCCAGDTLVRVTDRSAAYASLAGLLTACSPSSIGLTEVHESLVAFSLKVADADRIPLAKWIKFREREIGAADGHHIRDLRHRFVQHIETQAKKIASAKSDAERIEIGEQVEEDIHDDYKALREALKLEAWQVLPTKEVIVSALGGAAALAGIALNIRSRALPRVADSLPKVSPRPEEVVFGPTVGGSCKLAESTAVGPTFHVPSCFQPSAFCPPLRSI